MTEPFFGTARIEAILRDFSALRGAIRSHDTEATEAAWEKCERWLFSVCLLKPLDP